MPIGSIEVVELNAKLGIETILKAIDFITLQWGSTVYGQHSRIADSEMESARDVKNVLSIQK